MANKNTQVKSNVNPTAQTGNQSRIIFNANKKVVSASSTIRRQINLQFYFLLQPKESSGVIVAPKVAPAGMKLDTKGKSRKVL